MMNYTIPFIFQENIGQYENKIKFLLKQKEYTTFFKDYKIEFHFTDKVNKLEKKYKKSMLCMTLENFNENSLIIGENRFTCNLNYLRGNKKENCINNIPIYEKIKYIDVYEGIDLIFYENKTKLEHDFIIK